MLDGAPAGGCAGTATSPAFAGFVRTGATVEMKAFTGLTGDAGGYAVPQEIDATIDRTLGTMLADPQRIANVVKVGSAGYRKLVTTGGTPSGWAGETDPRPKDTATPVFAEIAPPMGELYASPSASQAMLDDAAFDVEAWLADEIAAQFASAEGAAFVSGSGHQPAARLPAISRSRRRRTARARSARCNISPAAPRAISAPARRNG